VGLTARKQAEIGHRLASLERELEHWRAEAAEHARLEKHHTQVEAVATELAVPMAAMRQRVAALAGDGTLEAAADIEGVVADLHRLWDLFRGRLALRYVEHFSSYLIAADELAYRCYEPAEAFGAAREPPLVAFGDETSPVTRPRGEELRVPAGIETGDPIGEALQRLPVALIDLPWSQLEHLPDAPIIAHEVGHDVEADLKLGPELDAVLEAALEQAEVDEKCRQAWRAWRGEIFADVFGTLALGPVFTSSLIDFLAAGPRVVAVEWQGEGHWRAHPPSTLRVLLSAAVLEIDDVAGKKKTYAEEARRLREEWQAAYPSHQMKAFECHVAAVANALVAGPYEALRRGPLTALIKFPMPSFERARKEARGLLRNVAPAGTDARELVAAARLAFEDDPSRYDASRVPERVLHRIRATQKGGVRTGVRAPVDAGTRRRRDTAAGHWLTDLLSDAHGLPPDTPEEDDDDDDLQA
jgi:hypothetical protein